MFSEGKSCRLDEACPELVEWTERTQQIWLQPQTFPTFFPKSPETQGSKIAFTANKLITNRGVTRF
ncbi:MAG: hypothetical protein A3J73_07285 [Planctomycetes bacterium RIFCSPHIGHO2_02_FULL_38_41]|nr:MAG: hypothetical protein A3J73_07285 [Planctomycetes bacterium RIFCSPHIGHO2_02_FULL_38_41]OHB92565.1 MAG: hypothetical protein A2Z57_00145 [Planctomycetes bacterium RIFCSPHIGHO2_12_39_6]OHB97378.1 MAG: hypothetical protein A2W74_06130 [Planctomycetes bacterium RIFCSPLOWO2_12_38_17]